MQKIVKYLQFRSAYSQIVYIILPNPTLVKTFFANAFQKFRLFRGKPHLSLLLYNSNLVLFLVNLKGGYLLCD
jgi:hypothetical protein